MFAIIKSIHILCAAVSIIGFTLRGFLKITSPDKLAKKWIKISPHIIDTLLLLSAVILVFLTEQYPTTNTWIIAKLIALIAYIGLGMLTLKFAQSRPQILAAFIAALLCYTYIISVALTKTVWPF